MSNNITITFPDGNTKSVEKGISGFELANQISKSLAKESVAIQINGKICDLSLELNEDCKVVIIKNQDIINLFEQSSNPEKEEIEGLINQRNEARRDKDFKLADEIRDKLKIKGIEIEDTTAPPKKPTKPITGTTKPGTNGGGGFTPTTTAQNIARTTSRVEDGRVKAYGLAKGGLARMLGE